MTEEIIDAQTKEIVVKQSLTPAQIAIITGNTPKQHIRERQGKGGRMLKYVDYAYVTDTLNRAFGWDWDFEVEVDELVTVGDKPFEARCRGRLTVKLQDGRRIVKTQYGSQAIEFLKSDETKPVSIGDAYKGAATDCLKKCASLLGVALDVYDSDSDLNTGRRKEKPEPTREQLLARYNQLAEEAKSIGIEPYTIVPSNNEDDIKKFGKMLGELISDKKATQKPTAAPTPQPAPVAETVAASPTDAKPDAVTGQADDLPPIRTGKQNVKILVKNWSDVSKEIAAEFPMYQDEHGKPEAYHILGALYQEGLDSITPENVATLADLMRRHISRPE